MTIVKVLGYHKCLFDYDCKILKTDEQHLADRDVIRIDLVVNGDIPWNTPVIGKCVAFDYCHKASKEPDTYLAVGVRIVED